MRGVFVTGTDTGVGKTLACAALMAAGPADLRYWKPVQSGADDDDDRETVRRLAGLAPERIVSEGVRLRAPASPHHAAALEGRVLSLAPLEAIGRTLSERVVVEGAGGLLVPLSDRLLLPDLVAALELPLLVVASTRLGTINHILLTLAEAHRRGLAVTGLVLSGAPDPSARTALAAHAPEVPVAELPPLDPTDADALARAGRTILAMPPLAQRIG
ncbi:MAG: dethiobiotin synthase [Deltaproteobacteria bacterium]|nr:dethiobiotin synthase [Deltaproteobacteria bacterium]